VLRRQFLGPAEVHPPRFGFVDPVHLPFGPELRLKLGDGPLHMEQQAAGGIARVDVLIEDVEIDLLPGQGLGNLAQMSGGACELVEARHHEGIPLPDIVQAGTQLGACARRTAVGLLREFVTVLQLLESDVQTLPDRTHPCIPYPCRGA
jgi:hypothetical protein